MATAPADPEYSVIVPAYNEARELPATLAAIRAAMKAQGSSGECIVVDNNSDDSTAETAARHGADRVVFEPANQIARARNTGAAAARGLFLVFVDADTRICPQVLEAALTALRSGTVVGGGSLVRFEDDPGTVGRFGILLWERISRTAGVAAGCFIFCRRDAFEAVGGFDERLFASEEIRISRQLKREGRRRSMRFAILTDTPVRTSARKLRWHSGPRVVAYTLFLCLMPLALRSRRLCGFWYRRPAAPPAPAVPSAREINSNHDPGNTPSPPPSAEEVAARTQSR
ncbi:MAG: glycosyltransferase [Opitutales bacterium]|nr:glycosyltransferase [Opitutales bacterium]